jgi:hypothetical protein
MWLRTHLLLPLQSNDAEVWSLEAAKDASDLTEKKR